MSYTDDEIRQAQLMLAREEGPFVEPSSAASLAGLIKGLGSGAIDREEANYPDAGRLRTQIAGSNCASASSARTDHFLINRRRLTAA